MSTIETYRGAIYPWHCDFIGHMNVMHYVGKFDQATWHFLASLGITPDYLRQSQKGMVAVEQHIRYFREALAGDLIYITTECLEAKPKAITFLHKMYNATDQELLAEGRMVGVHIDMQTRKSVPLPEAIQSRFPKSVE